MSDKTVALEIIKQMGGFGKLRAMVSARDFVYDDNSIMFRFSGKRGINKCRVIYNYGTGLYTFELWYLNTRKATCDLKYQLEDVYFDMLIPLFEEETGLYLSL